MPSAALTAAPAGTSSGCCSQGSVLPEAQESGHSPGGKEEAIPILRIPTHL